MDPRRIRPNAAVWGSLLLAALLILLLQLAGGFGDGAVRARPTPLRLRPTAEPLVPTPLPAYRATPQATSAAEESPTVAPPPPFRIAAAGDPARARVCAGVPLGRLDDYDWGDAEPGWYLNWWIMEEPPATPGTRFVQVVYTRGADPGPAVDQVQRTARRNPGSLWLIGNEPDVAWQGNATPEQYAAGYARLHAIIKEADPTALVAIGGVSQPTPLRLAYLDRVLEAYRKLTGSEMPVDVWNVHAFILREERDSWGVGIPPGMVEERGTLYEITDHDDIALFREQIVAFRRWMKARGLQDKPLIVSEYGILMPESYGFPPEAVAAFLVDSFDFFLTAADPELGLPGDENRLVQAFCWYSAADTTYPTPNLFDPATRAVTPVGEVFRVYVSALPAESGP